MGLKELQRKLARDSNAGIIGGLLLFINSFACPCPFCYIGSATLFLGGIAGKFFPGGKSKN
jgi:hypothetical protein